MWQWSSGHNEECKWERAPPQAFALAQLTPVATAILVQTAGAHVVFHMSGLGVECAIMCQDCGGRQMLRKQHSS